MLRAWNREPLRKVVAWVRVIWLGGAVDAVDLAFSLAWLAIVTWLIARAVNQRGLLPRLARAFPPERRETPHVTVIIPARDEADNIGRCLNSILAQDYPALRLNVIVVDDHSADGTAAIVRGITAGHPRLALMQSPPLPPRWTGKSHACWIGARAAPPETEWLCFIDADVWGDSALLSSAVRAVLDHKLDLLSLTPRQYLKSFAERLILPCGLILLSFVQNLARAQARSGSQVTATGQFILVRRASYDAVGGHAAVSNEICEDREFARRLKQSGHAVLLMDGADAVSTRMYTGWRTLWPGLAKNLIDTLGGRSSTLLLATIAVTLAWAAVAIPVQDAAACLNGVPGAWLALIPALLASAAAFGLHIAAARHFRIPLYYGLLFPLGYTVGAAMALDSVRRRLYGGVVWKGRIYS